MAPHLVRWHEEMKDRGLVVISVENGTITPLEEVRATVAERRTPHPVLHDGAGENVAQYGVRAYPAAYLIDRSGRVAWQGTPVRNVLEVERRIRGALDD